MRLAVLGLWHEANTFVTRLADEDTMAEVGVIRGADVRDRFGGGASTVSGFLAIEEEDPLVSVVPLVMTQLVPRGPISRTAFAARADEFVELLTAHGPFDGVLAALHGAAVAEGCHDVDGTLLRRIRETVGPDVPIGAALDLHANISTAMCELTDVLNTYRTNPHLDARDTALEVARVVVATARGEVAPVVAHVAVPVAVNILTQSTSEPPMSELMALVDATSAEPGVLAASIAEGFPYADVAEMGMSVVVVTDADRRLAERLADRLADAAWERRHALDATALSPQDAVALVKAGRADRSAPVLLLDVGDNIGGGSAGDSVALLNAARAGGLESVLAIVADEAAASVAVDAGADATLRVTFGAREQPETGPAVDAEVVVLAVDDGLIVADTASAHAGVDRLDAGPSAAVRLDSGQTVVLTSKAAPPFSIDQVTRLGIDPATFAAIVAKGVHSPRSAYGPYVSEMVMVDTPGPTRADLRGFTYRHRRRPMFPFESTAILPPRS